MVRVFKSWVSSDQDIPDTVDRCLGTSFTCGFVGGLLPGFTRFLVVRWLPENGAVFSPIQTGMYIGTAPRTVHSCGCSGLLICNSRRAAANFAPCRSWPRCSVIYVYGEVHAVRTDRSSAAQTLMVLAWIPGTDGQPGPE